MTWGKLDDGFATDPKVLALDDAAGFFLVRSWSLIGQHRTDGFLSVGMIDTLDGRGGRRKAAALVRAGFYHRYPDECPCMKGQPWPGRGWWVHQYLRYNPSRAENDVHRAQRAELRNPTLRLEVVERDGGLCRYCRVETSEHDHRSERGRVLDHVNPKIAAGAQNLVVACRGCNSRKRARTPDEAGMTLLPPPTADPPDPRQTHDETRVRRGSVVGLVVGSDVDRRTATAPAGQPDTCPPGPTPNTMTTAPGRDGTGSGSGPPLPGQVGPAATPRLLDVNPYLRSGHVETPAPAANAPP